MSGATLRSAGPEQHNTSCRVRPCAGQAPSWGDAAWGGLQQGQQTAKAQPVFARLEGDPVIGKPEAAGAAK